LKNKQTLVAVMKQTVKGLGQLGKTMTTENKGPE